MYDAYVRLTRGVTPEILQPRLTGMWNDLARQFPTRPRTGFRAAAVARHDRRRRRSGRR